MSKVAKNAMLIMAVTMISKVLGLGRDVALTSAYGLTDYSGIYITVSNIPDVIFIIIATAITTTFIPLYYEVKKTQSEERLNNFSDNVFTIAIITSILLALIGFVFAKPIVKLFAVGLTGKNLEVATTFAQIIIPSGFFIGISAIMSAYLNIIGDFTTPNSVTIPYNIIIIAAIIISAKFNLYILAYGTAIAIAIKFFHQAFVAYRKGFKYRFRIDFKDEYLKKMMILVVPVLISVGIGQINGIVDRTMASLQGMNAVAALSYANKLNIFITGVFTTSLTTVVYPMLANLSTDNNRKKFNQSIVKSINIIVVIIIPITIGAIAFAEPIVKIIFERGKFDAAATKMTLIALVCYAPSMIAYGLRDILGKIFYSIQDTKTPTTNGMLCVAINIFLDIVLSKLFGYINLGYAGLALATSISSLTCAVILMSKLGKKIGNYGQKRVYRVMLKTIIASLLMGALSFFIYEVILSIIGKEIIALGVAVIVGGSSYLWLIRVFYIKESDIIFNMINPILRKLKIVK